MCVCEYAICYKLLSCDFCVQIQQFVFVCPSMCGCVRLQWSRGEWEWAQKEKNENQRIYKYRYTTLCIHTLHRKRNWERNHIKPRKQQLLCFWTYTIQFKIILRHTLQHCTSMEPHFKRFYIIVIEICSNFDATWMLRQRNEERANKSAFARAQSAVLWNRFMSMLMMNSKLVIKRRSNLSSAS